MRRRLGIVLLLMPTRPEPSSLDRVNPTRGTAGSSRPVLKIVGSRGPARYCVAMRLARLRTLVELEPAAHDGERDHRRRGNPRRPENSSIQPPMDSSANCAFDRVASRPEVRD